uniref:Lectizyme n=1 Tax=Glossina austeni TaxID=7395 RepID=A0A1A9UZ54_GLOAU
MLISNVLVSWRRRKTDNKLPSTENMVYVGTDGSSVELLLFPHLNNTLLGILHVKLSEMKTFLLKFLLILLLNPIFTKILNRKPSHGGRIVGGFRAQTDDEYAKYVVFMLETTGRAKYFGSQNFCGGTIIAPDYVLTAAHCVAASDVKSLRVIAGNRRRLRRSKNVQRRRVLQIIIHYKYQAHLPISQNDIALVKLRNKLHIDNRYRGVAELGFNAYLNVDETCIAAGWGRMYHHGPQPNHILYVEKTVYQIPYIGNTIFTSSSSVYVQHTCNADSGGPLFCRGKLYGVTWAGDLACLRTSMFTSVPHHRQWIELYIFASSSNRFSCFGEINLPFTVATQNVQDPQHHELLGYSSSALQAFKVCHLQAGNGFFLLET